MTTANNTAPPKPPLSPQKPLWAKHKTHVILSLPGVGGWWGAGCKSLEALGQVPVDSEPIPLQHPDAERVGITAGKEPGTTFTLDSAAQECRGREMAERRSRAPEAGQEGTGVHVRRAGSRAGVQTRGPASRPAGVLWAPCCCHPLGSAGCHGGPSQVTQLPTRIPSSVLI